MLTLVTQSVTDSMVGEKAHNMTHSFFIEASKTWIDCYSFKDEA